MQALPRWLVVPVLVVFVAAIVVARPQDDERIANSWQSEDPEIQAARQKMDAYQQVIGERIAYKNALITEMLEGRATLEEVSDEFLRLNREMPASMIVIRTRHREAHSDEERSTWNVLEYVEERLSREDHDPKVLADLRRQFLARFGHVVFETDNH